MDPETVVADNSNTAEEVTPEVTEEIVVEEKEVDLDDIETVKAKLEKERELAKNYKIRAEKAEKQSKEKKPVEITGALSEKDLISIVRNEVHDDDLDVVKRFAKLENITVSEALKRDDLKVILKGKKEQRETAAATNTGSTRRAPAKPSDEALIDRASKGELPQSDEDLERLAAARMNNRKNRK